MRCRVLSAFLGICCFAIPFSGPAARPASAKDLPPPVSAPANLEPADPARLQAVAELAAAKSAGQVAAAHAIEARLGPVAAATSPSPGSTLRVLKPEVSSPIGASDKWGGDVRITAPDWSGHSPALAVRGDGTMFAAAASLDGSEIRVFRSDDDGATWSWDFSIVSAETLESPSLAIGEGTFNRLLLAFVTGSGGAGAGVMVYTVDFDDLTGSFTTVVSYPYLAFRHPRLCTDSPIYAYWYPYLVWVVQGIDTSGVLQFSRSLDYGDTWLFQQMVAPDVPLAARPDLDFGGGMLAVVHEHVGAGHDIQGRISRDFGGTWEPVLTLAGSWMEESEPQVAITAAGDRMLVAFARQYAPGDCDIDGVWSQDQGATWTGTYLPYSAADERRPALAASPVTGHLHAAYWRDGGIRYTAADDPQSWSWSPDVRIDDRGAAADAWPAIATRPAPCACAPDLNCDGVVDFDDLSPFEMAMYDPYGYAAAYPDCDIDQADLDCDGDIDAVDYDAIVCLLTGGEDCCPTTADNAGLAWHDGQPSASGVWFDTVLSALPPAVDCLLICPDALDGQAQRLANYRRSRGLIVDTVQLSDIADGTPTAVELDAWLESYWTGNPQLRFVILVGGVQQLPSFPLVYPETGEPFFSDLRYACRDATYPADYLPQLAVGRLPAATASQLDAVIDKIERFEAGYGGGGRVLCFGNQPEMGYAAARDSALAASLGYAVTMLTSPTEAALMAALNAPDPTLAFYYGHGSASANWPLHSGNLDLLTNHDRPWLDFSGGCSFNDDTLGFPPLGHTLLFSPGGPAANAGAAVAGGYGYAYEFVPGLLYQSRVQQTYGEMVAAALAHLQAAALAGGQDIGPDSSTRWFAERLRIIGDPALRVDGDLTAVPPSPPTPTTMMRGVRPNPFNASTTVDFTLPADGVVRLTVYAATGRRVAVLVDGFLAEGTHETVWHGRDQQGRSCPSAVYFLRLEAAGRAESRRIVLVK